MNVKIGIGLGKILFGMHQEQVLSLLGKPDKIVTPRDDGIEWLYNTQKLKLFFDYEEQKRLYSIEVFDKNITFLSQHVIGMPLKVFLDFMSKNQFHEYETSDFDYFDTLYFEACNTSFTIEYGDISSFEFSPLFKDENTILWPDL